MSSWNKKQNGEPNDERRYSLAPIEQMRVLAAGYFSYQGQMSLHEHFLKT
jgi:hypothetical protein